MDMREGFYSVEGKMLKQTGERWWSGVLGNPVKLEMFLPMAGVLD